MASVVVNGDTSGAVTLSAPAVAGTVTVTLPAASGTMLTTASSGQSIPKAALPTGSVLQVVNATFSTAQTTTSTSYQASGLTLSITPTSNTSKILITGAVPYDVYGGSSNQATLALYKGATNLMTNGFAIIASGGSNEIQSGSMAVNFLDSPATTSSTTYTIYFRVAPTAGGTPTARIFVDNYTGTLTAMEIAA